ncbi:LPXTG cell wall anchor domain-containing protein, partial [Ligilactobacillus salivarius]|uniref:LPXTG cell wall anchor domain-containing protein n=1 Tax=Ligilactobacillus salivarius TaxID=1624 RepID=UPI00136ADE02
KQAAQDAIDKLNNLNEAQKAAAKAAIEQASSLAEVSTASDKATNLDSSMGDLKKASIDSESIKNNVEYVNASADKQKAFDDAMKAASDVLNGKQADYKTVLDLIISLSNAKDNLDGAKKFNNSKQVAKVVIDNLANLNDAQKVTAKKEIDSATQENAITTAVNKAKNLDDLMIKLHAAIELAAQTRVTVRYLNASPELREAYDKVVKLSKEVVAKNGNDTNANDIQLLLQALETAQNALNGKEIVVTPDSSQSNQTDSNSNSDNKLENKTANPSKATATAKNKVSTSEKLPQTGDTSDNNVSIIGATLASIAGLFGLGSLYKKKEDK